MPRAFRRSGFTLIELLVVISIIALLLAILLPAVFQVRQSVSRTQCQNNLKNIGLGLTMYHNSNRAFPPAHVTNNSACPVPRPDNLTYFSWMCRILPYIDQDNVYKQIDFNAWPWWQHPINETIMPLYKCPWDIRQDYVANYGGANLVALSGYMGVSGTDQFAFDGVLHVNAKVALRDITDGGSNTIVVGERPPSEDLVYGWWMAGSGDSPFYGATDVVLGVTEKRTATGPAEMFRDGTIVDPPNEHRWHFWSLHRGGSNFTFADGSVRFIAYGSANIMPALATYKGGEMPTIP